jgi:hypothetical protein
VTRHLQAVPECPNAAAHEWHPTRYVSHSGWADRALLVADQERCPGCGGWEIWVPKRPDLRIAADWTAQCGWDGCESECVGDRRVEPHVWVPACAEHAEVET